MFCFITFSKLCKGYLLPRYIHVKMKVKLLSHVRLFATPWTVAYHEIFQAIVLEWIAISFSRGSFQPRDWTQVSLIVDRRFTVWATREVLILNPKNWRGRKWQCHDKYKSLGLPFFFPLLSSLYHSCWVRTSIWWIKQKTEYLVCWIGENFLKKNTVTLDGWQVVAGILVSADFCEMKTSRWEWMRL